MILRPTYWMEQKFLPTKRHHKERSRYLKREAEIEIKELKEADFPLAFIVHNYHYVSENAKSWKELRDGDTDFRIFADEIRTYQDRLYKKCRISYGTTISTCCETPENIEKRLSQPEPYCLSDKYEFSEQSVIISNNSEAYISMITENAGKYAMFRGEPWEVCNEPMYMINTFGLGHNHGGTGFFIDDCYNPNIGARNYFNALHREEAVTYGKKVAAARGDTEYIAGMGNGLNIEVIMPEMVKANPQKDHGSGDPWDNEMEELVESAGSAMEAELLVMMKTAMAINSGN